MGGLRSKGSVSPAIQACSVLAHKGSRYAKERWFNQEGEEDMTSQFKLEGTVGPNDDVEPRDSRKVKQALIELGFPEKPEGGIAKRVTEC